MDDSDLTGSDMDDLLASPIFRRTATGEDYMAAVEARSYVDVAIGITMGRHDCTCKTALANLHRIASQFNITIVELAKAIRFGSGK